MKTIPIPGPPPYRKARRQSLFEAEDGADDEISRVLSKGEGSLLMSRCF